MAHQFKPATISKASFAFCRTTLATLLWLALIFQNPWVVVVTSLIMLLSAIFKVEHAPLILLWKYTIERKFPSKPEIVDERGIYVSHIVGAIFSIVCLSALYFHPFSGWILTIAFAILQTSAACGFCSALKLYTCMNNGTCCKVGKKLKQAKERLENNV